MIMIMIIVGFIMLLMGMNYKSHNLPMIKLPIFGAECCGTDRSSFWKTLVAPTRSFCGRIGSIQLLSTLDPFRHGKTRGADWPPLLVP